MREWSVIMVLLSAGCLAQAPTDARRNDPVWELISTFDLTLGPTVFTPVNSAGGFDRSCVALEPASPATVQGSARAEWQPQVPATSALALGVVLFEAGNSTWGPLVRGPPPLELQIEMTSLDPTGPDFLICVTLPDDTGISVRQPVRLALSVAGSGVDVDASVASCTFNVE